MVATESPEPTMGWLNRAMIPASNGRENQQALAADTLSRWSRNRFPGFALRSRQPLADLQVFIL